jgi:ribosomal protein L25 (general stress protein Ctc)
MLVRQSYVKLWDLVMDKRQKRQQLNASGVAIGGNSGVGKSMFLAYAMKRLVDAKDIPAIVYDRTGEESVAVILPDNVFFVNRFTAENQYLRNYATVYLVDVGGDGNSRCPPKYSAFTIVVASPHSAHSKIKDWLKQTHAPQLYMPCWSSDELLACRSAQQLAISADEVKQRVDRFGGIARTVLTDTIGNWDKKTEVALNTCDLNALSLSVHLNLEKLPEQTSMLLHFGVDETTFQVSSINLASDHIARLFSEKVQTTELNITLKFLRATSGVPSWGGIRGYTFEAFAHTILKAGGIFKAAQFINAYGSNAVKGGEVKKARHVEVLVEVPRSDNVQMIANPSDIFNLQNGFYGRPSIATFPTIDSVVRPNMLFQVTGSSSHDVNIDGLVKAVKALNVKLSDRVSIFFVVPPEQFDTFAPGTFAASKKKEPAKELTINDIPPNVDYYVLRLYQDEPLPVFASASGGGSSGGSSSSSSNSNNLTSA